MNNISIRKMRVFLSAASEGSFTRASAKQNVSQPAATIIINQIEESVGCELFERQGTARRAVLTSEGQMVAETFSRIVAGYDTELSRISELRSGRRGSRLILVQSPLSDALSQVWLRALVGAMCDTRVKLETCRRTEIVERVQARDAALGVIDGDAADETFDYLQIGAFRMVLAVPVTSPFASALGAEVRWEDIPKGSFMMTGHSDRILRRVYESLRSANRSPDDFNEVLGIGLLAKLMADGGFPAILPDAYVRPLCELLPCKTITLACEIIESGVGLMAPWGHMSRLRLGRIRNIACFDPIQ